MTVLYAIFVIAIVVQCQCIDLRKEWETHNIAVSNFKCGQPQPRSFQLEELMDTNDILTGKILPASTVLHRCGGAGCCRNQRQQCSPVAEEEVTLVFGILGARGGPRYVPVSAKNHTKCSCQNVIDRPK